MFHVIINGEPYDCMGHRVKDNPYSRIEDAINSYKDFLINKSKTIEEFCALYWDEDAIEEAKEEDYSLIVDGQICLLSCEVDLSSDPEVSCDTGYNYGCWINDYDDLTYKNLGTSLLELYESFGAEMICSYDYEIPVLEYDEECLLRIISDCDQSLRMASEKISGMISLE